VQLIDVSEVEWCDEAVLIHVKNGKGTLTHRIGEEDEEYTYFSQLLLNDKPIIQGKYPICPTCAGMLATGYGIENIHSQELEKVRECMNLKYKGIINSVESIKPLLGLLNDGYYVLADVKLYPSDGQGTFFYSVPNELTYNEATCSEYYDSKFYSSVDGFPAYIYPTQSSELIQEARVEEYIRMMKSNSNSLRGLAYYEEGFVCALLDGHHKACAASALGKPLSCLTIIPPDSFYYAAGAKYADGDTLLEKVGFAGIMIDVEQGAKLKDYSSTRRAREKDIHIPLYDLTGRKLPDHYINRYPTIETMAGIINAEVDVKANAAEYAKTLISAYDEECAIKELLNHRNEETEQYLIDYLANHNSEDPCWDLVSSYWE